jgi:hypothetical protein
VVVDAEHRPLVIFRIVARRDSEIIKTFLRVSFFSAQEPATPSRVFSSTAFEEEMMGRGILLWLLGVPIPVIILLWLFFGR